MRIAIAKEGNKVSQHFGHCEGFEVFNVKDHEVVTRTFIENPGHRPGFLPSFLAEMKVDVIVSGGMGASAQELFNRNNIEVIVGASGDIEDVINSFIEGDLETTNAVCTEHQHHGQCGH